jgi:hypothetical protein
MLCLVPGLDLCLRELISLSLAWPAGGREGRGLSAGHLQIYSSRSGALNSMTRADELGLWILAKITTNPKPWKPFAFFIGTWPPHFTPKHAHSDGTSETAQVWDLKVWKKCPFLFSNVEADLLGKGALSFCKTSEKMEKKPFSAKDFILPPKNLNWHRPLPLFERMTQTGQIFSDPK